ncbi:hypothetical protein [Maribacter sp. 2210JD10-5]|uniref:hypothetical protein n=1 Tax=Maribacter sp. 2210JD10-5 TaxID=3386272 RepID=UPI0039BD82F8
MKNDLIERLISELIEGRAKFSDIQHQSATLNFNNFEASNRIGEIDGRIDHLLNLINE